MEELMAFNLNLRTFYDIPNLYGFYNNENMNLWESERFKTMFGN